MTYDVLYDERVRGELCVEKNVPAYRLVSSRQVKRRPFYMLFVCTCRDSNSYCDFCVAFGGKYRLRRERSGQPKIAKGKKKGKGELSATIMTIAT